MALVVFASVFNVFLQYLHSKITQGTLVGGLRPVPYIKHTGKVIFIETYVEIKLMEYIHDQTETNIPILRLIL